MDLFLIVVIVLFVLAISDLIVGVSNDAVNFLNSAIGSKVAPRHIIMIVASIGILVGTTFSSGLMEVARKGIFHPDQFLLPEIMVIFLAVMLTDVLLLDLFNTFALPTSTTVSIVFELLGAAVAVSMLKIYSENQSLSDLIRYINTGQALAIISGILLSVAVAFSSGTIIQFFTRLIFTFDYEKKIKRYGAIWGGIALTAITYFILVKGAKGSSIITSDTQNWIKENTQLILIGSILFWGIILQILLLFTKINILKPIVLVGTFALALAFAANDLVNFIGVPLAGLSSYSIGLDSANPLTLTMEALKEPVQSNTLLLLLAGITMVVTLWFSRKARSVTKTEVNLGRQAEGFERFDSSLLSRAIVRFNISIFDFFRKAVPQPVQDFIQSRFDNTQFEEISKNSRDVPAFDLLRASVNLMVASMVISFATSLKLPLSTTYVTFMVAMGSSLSDKAWGRESAVYRVTGVLTVIGGWFFTAFIAFSVAAIFATIIFFFKLPATIVLALIAGVIVIRTHILHKKREEEQEQLEVAFFDSKLDTKKSLEKFIEQSVDIISSVKNIINETFKGLDKENREILRGTKKHVKELKKKNNKLVSNIFISLKTLPESDVKKDRRYGKIIASMQNIFQSTKNIATESFDHLDNNHKKPTSQQLKEIHVLQDLLKSEIEETSRILSEKDFNNTQKIDDLINVLNDRIREFDENQLLRIKQGSSTNKGSMLYLDILGETENISSNVKNLVSLYKKNYSEFLEK
ncbi:MAG: inorganic phosphate transporter [Ignavibacteria bacterium]|jgi:phosphate/sulfate permease